MDIRFYLAIISAFAIGIAVVAVDAPRWIIGLTMLITLVSPIAIRYRRRRIAREILDDVSGIDLKHGYTAHAYWNFNSNERILMWACVGLLGGTVFGLVVSVFL